MPLFPNSILRMLGYRQGVVAPAVEIATFTATLTEINAGKVVVEKIPGFKITPLDFVLDFNGTFTTATDIRLSTTDSTPVDIATVLIAAAVDNAFVRAAGSGAGAIGAGFNAEGSSGEGVQIRKTGSAAAGGTSIRGWVMYQITAIG